ncbi:unnamed protein product [Spirodela intermedia]|uniref:Uncharacterized protein n=1 Tax=Spirodela intermedia TaxID=51605 RepID=A0A7I8IIM0_SPIIN|nr:unnamed protein product [Spirodela intermedia]CAA6657722.1 unnamed protein product [Spirodela intermedia]
MGFDVSHLPQVQSLHSSLKALGSRKAIFSRHKRCKSDSDRRLNGDDPDLPILQLEKRLQGQFSLRHALEKALGYRSSTVDASGDNLMPKPTKELIREIAVLEVEVRYLEQYLLSLYRKAFGEQASSLSPSRVGERSEPSADAAQSVVAPHGAAGSENPPKQGNSSDRAAAPAPPPWKQAGDSGREGPFSGCPRKLTGPGAHRSHSALSQRSICSGRGSPQAENLARALRECHSQPLSSLDPGGVPRHEHRGPPAGDAQQDLVKCVGSIYCKLAETPLVCPPGLSSPASSSFSSMCPFSPQYQGDPWSPGRRKDPSLDAWLENPFRVEGLKEFSGPYNVMVEVPAFCLSADRLVDVEDMLHRYKSLALRLESVDPRKMKHEEKVAFWINIHNASVMHAYLTHGVPQNNLKRLGLLLKAACNVGGRIVTADAIQNSILGCRTHRPAQWLRAFLSPGLKVKKADDWQAYAIDHPEPLLHFALCSGSHSDPAVRVYSPKRLLPELEKARRQKILLPKVVEAFAKDAGLSPAGLLSMIQRYSRRRYRWPCGVGSHGLAFRYLLSRDLANSDLK